jgi:phosphohistidine phosphatase
VAISTVYLMRHAHADTKPSATSEYLDDRCLSEEGQEKLEKSLPFFRSLDIPLEAIVSSPMARARETAEYVARATGLAVQTDELLLPGAEPSCYWRVLRADRLQGVSSVLMVAHEPDLGHFLGTILGGAEHAFPFKRAALASITLEGRIGRLRYFVPNRFLREGS